MNIKGLWSFAQVFTGVGGLKGIRHVIEQAEQDVMHLGELISSGDQSVSRLETGPPGGGVNVMVKEMPLREKLKLLPMMLKIVNTFALSSTYMKNYLAPTHCEADKTFWNSLEAFARTNGAVEFGFTRINEHDIFKDYAIPYRNAIVFTIDMEKEAINTAPSYEAGMEVAQTYASLGELAMKLTDLLLEQGYGAYPGFPIGGLVDYVRVAANAGIGAIGYHGMLISPTEGTRQRINVVFTNMEIPESLDNEHDWVLDFCAKCQKCVHSCPPEAIYTSAPINSISGRKQTVHYEKCVDYFGKNQGCAICVKVCPFSQAGYKKIQNGFLKKHLAN